MPRTHQSGYAVLPLSPPHADDKVRAVEAFIQEHYAKGHSNEALADLACMSERAFLRRFKAATGRAPAAYLQAVRVEAAKAILEREASPIQTVSEAVGYQDASFFRGLFKRETGMTPAEYRTRFAAFSVREPENVDLRAVH
jgi:transcriptional regulator GlxA family with amidase domain